MALSPLNGLMTGGFGIGKAIPSAERVRRGRSWTGHAREYRWNVH